MLSNQKYIGIYEFKGTVNKGMYPPIVSQEMYDACQLKLRRNKHIGGRFTAREQFLLTGKQVIGKKFIINSLVVMANNNADKIDCPNVININDLKSYLKRFDNGVRLSIEEMDMLKNHTRIWHTTGCNREHIYIKWCIR